MFNQFCCFIHFPFLGLNFLIRFFERRWWTTSWRLSLWWTIITRNSFVFLPVSNETATLVDTLLPYTSSNLLKYFHVCALLSVFLFSSFTSFYFLFRDFHLLRSCNMETSTPISFISLAISPHKLSYDFTPKNISSLWSLRSITSFSSLSSTNGNLSTNGMSENLLSSLKRLCLRRMRLCFHVMKNLFRCHDCRCWYHCVFNGFFVAAIM